MGAEEMRPQAERQVAPSLEETLQAEVHQPAAQRSVADQQVDQRSAADQRAAARRVEWPRA